MKFSFFKWFIGLFGTGTSETVISKKEIQQMVYVPSVTMHHERSPDVLGAAMPSGGKKLSQTRNTSEQKEESPMNHENQHSRGANGTQKPISVETRLEHDDVAIIQTYINYLRSIYGEYLKPGVSLKTHAVPYDHGVVLEIKYDQDKPNQDVISDEIKPDVRKAFNELHTDIHRLLSKKQNKIFETHKKSDKPVFTGTGFLGTDDKLYIIKDYSKEQWTQKAAEKDVARILDYSYG